MRNPLIELIEYARKCVEEDRAGDAIPSIEPIEPREPRIELDEENQAEEADRIHKRFPIYIQHLLARRISIPRLATGLEHLTIDEIEDWEDDELAEFADEFHLITPSRPLTTRTIAYGRVLAVALRHFQDDPAAVRASIELVRMIANPRPRLGAGPSELDE